MPCTTLQNMVFESQFIVLLHKNVYLIKTGKENYSTYYCVKCNVLTFSTHFLLHSGDQVSHPCKTVGKVLGFNILLKYFCFIFAEEQY